MSNQPTDQLSQTESDGRTVWVHSPEGDCIGRFSRFGIDVHRGVKQQMAGEGECLHCTHEEPDAEDWKIFQAEVLHHYNVAVGDEHIPEFLKP